MSLGALMPPFQDTPLTRVGGASLNRRQKFSGKQTFILKWYQDRFQSLGSKNQVQLRLRSAGSGVITACYIGYSGSGTQFRSGYTKQVTWDGSPTLSLPGSGQYVYSDIVGFPSNWRPPWPIMIAFSVQANSWVRYRTGINEKRWLTWRRGGVEQAAGPRSGKYTLYRGRSYMFDNVRVA